MVRNLHAVIWSRIAGKSEKMGDLVLEKEQVSFTYTRDYLASGQPGFCLLGDGSIWQDETMRYPISERIPVFPRLLTLIPGNNPRNLQRRHYLDILRHRLGREPAPGFETEWQLMVMSGHGGIGHIDVFADDISAAAWYRNATHEEEENQSRNEDFQIGLASDNRSQLWRMLKNNVLDENIDFDPLLIEETLGPTPSVGGMIPKLLVSIDTDSKQAVFFPPDTPAKTEVVLKVEPPEYQGLLDLEALCLDIHREAGFEVPDYYRYDSDGLHFLAITRFDRQGDKPVPMESLFSVIATGNHHFRETGDILLEELGGIIDQLGQVVSLEDNTGAQLYRRFIMALLTGNGDLHLDNISLLGDINHCRLTPVYDPAPMRAWPRHNLVSAIPYDASSYQSHSHFFVALGKTFGLSLKQTGESIQRALESTENYAQRLMVLERVPQLQREQLRQIVAFERRELIKAVREI